MFRQSSKPTARRPVCAKRHSQGRWAKKTLVVGPAQPVDGDSVSCTVALIDYLRKKGLEAYTLPTLMMYRQIDWIISSAHIHPACRRLIKSNFTCDNLQAAYDALLEVWRPDEVVIVDGHLLGFDTRGVPLYVIDHHVRGAEVDDENGCIKAAPSCGCLLIERFGIIDPILAVSILTDTFWFRQNMPAGAIKHMARLVAHGLTDEKLAHYQKLLMVRKDAGVITAMQHADVRFGLDGDAAFVVLDETDPEIHRGVAGELAYFSRHMCVVRGDGYVSFRTVDERIDLRPLAEHYGRGGHAQQAAGQVDISDPAQVDQLYHDFITLVETVGCERSHRLELTGSGRLS